MRNEKGRGLRRYWIAAAATIGLFTIVFIVVEVAGVRIFTDPGSAMSAGGWTAALIGVTLLAADALLPVPSSLVMVLHGALFGPVAGAALSLVGRVGAAVVGFAVGRRGGPLLERFVGGPERERADRLLQRWGVVGIVLSRPIPLVAETTIVLAGASALSWPPAILAATVGSLPEVVLYALAGSAAAGFGTTSVVFLCVLAAAALTWIVVERFGTRSTAR